MKTQIDQETEGLKHRYILLNSLLCYTFILPLAASFIPFFYIFLSVSVI